MLFIYEAQYLFFHFKRWHKLILVHSQPLNKSWIKPTKLSLWMAVSCLVGQSNSTKQAKLTTYHHHLRRLCLLLHHLWLFGQLGGWKYVVNFTWVLVFVVSLLLMKSRSSFVEERVSLCRVGVKCDGKERYFLIGF